MISSGEYYRKIYGKTEEVKKKEDEIIIKGNFIVMAHKIIEEIKEREFKKYYNSPRVKNLVKRGRLTEEMARKQFNWICKETIKLMEEALTKLYKDWIRRLSSSSQEDAIFPLAGQDFRNKLIEFIEKEKAIFQKEKETNSRKAQSDKPKVTILDNNPLSIASFMEDNPNVYKKLGVKWR